MEKAHAINPERIAWCCRTQGLTIDDLSRDIKIAPATLKRAMEGEDVLSINQLRKIADYYNRGLLFFFEQSEVNESILHSPQFRTISNQKPILSPKLAALIERMEKQRHVHISLLEDLGVSDVQTWFPSGLVCANDNIKTTAADVRQWLGLEAKNTFQQLRRAVEAKNILVFVSNGYKGQWQISKENPIRGFSLFFPDFPIIAIKKQSTDGPQAFTLMHELAHLLLHKNSFIDEEDDFLSYRGKEKDANAFAGNILVSDGFLQEIDLAEFPENEVSTYDEFFRSSRKRWSVSTEVIIRRLVDEGFIETSSIAISGMLNCSALI